MQIKQRLKAYISAGFDVNEDIYLLRQLVLIHSLLLMTMVLLGSFTLYNIEDSHYLVATFDAIAFGACGYGYFQLRSRQKLGLAINIAILTLFVFLNTLTTISQNESFTLIWTIFFPIFTILLKGRKTGLCLVALYYAILIPQAFFGIDTWQNGAWDFGSFLRFSIASFVVVYSAYLNEFSFERSYNELHKLKQKEVDLAKQEAQTHAQMIDRKNKLLAEVSHELLTPLAALKINLEALEDGMFDDKDKTYQLLHSRLGDMNHLIADLNHMAEADIGSMLMKHQPVAISALLDNTIRSYQHMIAERGIKLHLNNRIPPEVMINGDEGRLIQVFTNLISNSCRYTDSQGTLHIEGRCGQHKLVIIFSDSAPGVSEEKLPRIFERLYQAESSRNRSAEGSGLGLAISRTIIQAHKGSITASASPLGGLSIEIQLPLIKS